MPDAGVKSGSSMFPQVALRTPPEYRLRSVPGSGSRLCPLPHCQNPMTQPEIPEIPDADRMEIEAALFRKLLDHLRKYPEVQNIDLMNLAYFCRNCFSKWYLSEATDRGIDLDYDQARELVYGMPYEEYKSRYQSEASSDQLAQFEVANKKATE
jgi:hypothetical protein